MPHGITGKLIRCIIFILLTGMLLASSPADAKTPDAQQLGTDKVIVLVIDDLGIEDLRNNKLKNINKIASSGAIGLMNTRTRGFAIQNRQAAYLTIGMGTRVGIPPNQAENETLINGLKKQYPNHIPGLVGYTANKTGKKIALLGNSDTDAKGNYTWLAAMDNFGYVDSVDAGSQLLNFDRKNVWGLRTDSTRLLDSCITAIQNNDIIFVDFGDTTRAAEARNRLGLEQEVLKQTRSEAIKRADLFLGELIKIIDKQNAVLLIISPTSPVDSEFTGIKNLAPVFLYKKGSVSGILTSDTTRREGLISNIDIAPGIFTFLGIETKMQFMGEKMTVLADSNPLRTIEKKYDKYVGLKKFRYVVHGVYVVLMFFVISFILLPVLKKKQQGSQRFGRAISVMIIAVPVTSSFAAVVLQDTAAAVVCFFILLILTGYILSGTTEIAVLSTAYMSLATAVFLIFDLLTGMGYLVNTPLGFNDVFTGGRYYGINNDSMGILLGSTVFGMFSLLERFISSRLGRLVVTTGVFFLVVLSLTPGFGANAGGTIAAITTGALAGFMLLSQNRPAMKTLFFVVILALAAEAALSFMDTLSANQTHAGKAAARLLTDDFSRNLLEIIGSKLGVFFAMLLLPPWNILFFTQLYFYRRVSISHVNEIKNIEQSNPLVIKSFRIILYGAGSVFIFNDTGIIAAAMMLIYVTVPFGMLLVREGCNLSEYRQAITQRI